MFKFITSLFAPTAKAVNARHDVTVSWIQYRKTSTGWVGTNCTERYSVSSHDVESFVASKRGCSISIPELGINIIGTEAAR